MHKKLFTSESVTEGHPDKVCDAISDAVLDDILSKDPMARVACESIVTTGMALVMGEISTECYADIPAIVRRTIREIGYNDPALGFDADTCAVLTSIDEQSPDIALGVDHSMEFKASGADRYDLIGAGDQGMMFGYATDETPEYMPAPIALSHRLSRRLAEARRAGDLTFLRPDGKSQVTVEYDGGQVSRVEAIVVSTQHTPDVSIETLREGVRAEIIGKVIDPHLIDGNTKIYINPTGRFVVGGPAGDSGLTGRKIIVDTYGGFGRHGGGAFSGKDPTKVDRSASYMLRYIAKNIVAAGLAKRCELEVAYAIGVAHPVSVYAETFGTGVMDDAALSALIREKFDLRPAAIIDTLDLRRPIYRATAAYGHFGRMDVDLPWERLDAVDRLK